MLGKLEEKAQDGIIVGTLKKIIIYLCGVHTKEGMKMSGDIAKIQYQQLKKKYYSQNNNPGVIITPEDSYSQNRGTGSGSNSGSD